MKTSPIFTMLMALPLLAGVPPALSAITAAAPAAAVDAAPARNPLVLPSLLAPTPADGFALALKLARMGVSQTQHDKRVLKAGRPEYAEDPEHLIAASHVVAVHFQTVAQANDYWRGPGVGQAE